MMLQTLHATRNPHHWTLKPTCKLKKWQIKEVGGDEIVVVLSFCWFKMMNPRKWLREDQISEMWMEMRVFLWRFPILFFSFSLSIPFFFFYFQNWFCFLKMCFCVSEWGVGVWFLFESAEGVFKIGEIPELPLGY